MKFTPWQLVTVLAILLAAVILANLFAPGATATIVSMATTVIAALFVNRHDGGDPPAGPGDGGAPALKLLNGGLGVLVLVATLAACGSSFPDIESAAAGGDVSDKLAECRAEARGVYYVEKKSKDEALAAYEACKKREGLQ